MAQLNRIDKAQKRWLRTLAKQVVGELNQSPVCDYLEVTPIGHLALSDGTTDGWLVTVAKIRGDRGGELQVWIDDYAAAGSRRLCYCYKSTRSERIKKLATTEAEKFGEAFTVNAFKRVTRNGKSYQQMEQPLPERQYNRPVAELYNWSWCFYSFYWPEIIRSGQNPPRALIGQIVRFFIDVTHALVALQEQYVDVEPYVPRVTMRRHIIRERRTKLALVAKIRDRFTCQVCGINFGDLYGEIGIGYVEAHHIVPLASIKHPKKIRVKDLITVCANCHRMIHRSIERDWKDGTGAIEAVRRAFTGRWPNPMV